MIPSDIVFLKKIPTNINGKVDLRKYQKIMLSNNSKQIAELVFNSFQNTIKFLVQKKRY